ncbi:MAG: CDP-alcohol phosphatidyltransferase family protein [Bacteroidetes bacterium]|nr:CDP-alcohol phosphatidyltransferase family protein [Bacteroidota bacterium]
MKIKQHIPNAITCGNLVCGCLAIVQAFNGNLVWAAYLVGIAAVLDFFDGFAARLLKVSSAIGKDLDSLADMVTFGVVPGVVMFQMIRMSNLWDLSIESHGDFGAFLENQYINNPWSYIAFLIPVFSALRLAKFNNDTRQSDSFIGVPTPANAILICSVALIVSLYPIHFRTSIAPSIEASYSFYYYIVSLFNSTSFLIITTIVCSILLVAPIQLIALKFKNFGWKGNEVRFVFLILALVLLSVFQYMGIPFVILFYVLLSVINNLLVGKKSEN